jgi:hypothetical protein
MGLFEQDSWLLVPLILLVVLAYDGVKLVVRKAVEGHRRRDLSPWSRGLSASTGMR